MRGLFAAQEVKKEILCLPDETPVSALDYGNRNVFVAAFGTFGDGDDGEYKETAQYQTSTYYEVSEAPFLCSIATRSVPLPCPRRLSSAHHPSPLTHIPLHQTRLLSSFRLFPSIRNSIIFSLSVIIYLARVLIAVRTHAGDQGEPQSQSRAGSSEHVDGQRPVRGELQGVHARAHVPADDGHQGDGLSCP